VRETEEEVVRKNQQLSTLSAELAKARETLEEEEKEEGEYVYMCRQPQSVTCIHVHVHQLVRQQISLVTLTTLSLIQMWSMSGSLLLHCQGSKQSRGGN